MRSSQEKHGPDLSFYDRIVLNFILRHSPNKSTSYIPYKKYVVQGLSIIWAWVILQT